MTKQFIQIVALVLAALTGCDGLPFPEGNWPGMTEDRVVTIAWEAHDGAWVDNVAVSCDVDTQTQGDITPAWDVWYPPGDPSVEIYLYEVDSQFDASCTGTVVVNDITMVMFGDDDDASMPNEDNDPGNVVFVQWQMEDRDFREGGERLRIYSR